MKYYFLVGVSLGFSGECLGSNSTCVCATAATRLELRKPQNYIGLLLLSLSLESCVLFIGESPTEKHTTSVFQFF